MDLTKERWCVMYRRGPCLRWARRPAHCSHLRHGPQGHTLPFSTRVLVWRWLLRSCRWWYRLVSPACTPPAFPRFSPKPSIHGLAVVVWAAVVVDLVYQTHSGHDRIGHTSLRPRSQGQRPNHHNPLAPRWLLPFVSAPFRPS